MTMLPEENQKHTYGIVLLAAGSSSRLGRPKQLVPVQGLPLVQHSLQVAITSGLGPVVVVLGANAHEVENVLHQHDLVYPVNNPEWQEGMASSIRCGINHLLQILPAAQGLILMVCDQPYVTPTLLQNLLTAHRQTGKPIITSSYADTFGPPTFFYKSLFAELLQLSGDVGARSVLRNHVQDVEAIPFAEGKLDIDTEADYQQIAKEGDV